MSGFRVEEFHSLTDVKEEMLIPEFFQAMIGTDLTKASHRGLPFPPVSNRVPVSSLTASSVSSSQVPVAVPMQMPRHVEMQGQAPQPRAQPHARARPLQTHFRSFGSGAPASTVYAAGSTTTSSSLVSVSRGGKYRVRKYRRDARRAQCMPYDRLMDLADEAPFASSLIGGDPVMSMPQPQPQRQVQVQVSQGADFGIFDADDPLAPDDLLVDIPEIDTDPYDMGFLGQFVTGVPCPPPSAMQKTVPVPVPGARYAPAQVQVPVPFPSRTTSAPIPVPIPGQQRRSLPKHLTLNPDVDCRMVPGAFGSGTPPIATDYFAASGMGIPLPPSSLEDAELDLLLSTDDSGFIPQGPPHRPQARIAVPPAPVPVQVQQYAHPQQRMQPMQPMHSRAPRLGSVTGYDDLFGGIPLGTNINQYLAHETAKIMRASGEPMGLPEHLQTQFGAGGRSVSPVSSVASSVSAASGRSRSHSSTASGLGLEDDVMDVSSAMAERAERPVVRTSEQIDRVIVHVGEKKSFRLFRGLIYYRKSTVRIRLVCRQPLRFDELSVFCHLEYKSFKTSTKDDPSLWLPCETPARMTERKGGLVAATGKRKKGVYVEYHFPKSGNEIEIQYCVTYNVKEMCHNTGKNYIRIHFTVHFSSTEMQEVAIPMIWDTHGKPKNSERPIRVKQLVCCCDKPFPKLYYRVTNHSEFVPITSFQQGVEPVFISQRFAPNGRTKKTQGKPKAAVATSASAAPAQPRRVRGRGHGHGHSNVHVEMLLALLKSVTLPTRFLAQRLPEGNRPVVQIALMNGIDSSAGGLLGERHVQLIQAPAQGPRYIDNKQTSLAQLLSTTCRKDGFGFVLIYDMSRRVVSPGDIINAFVFAYSHVVELRKRGVNAVVSATWEFNFGPKRSVTLDKIFEALSRLDNAIVLCSVGNDAKWLPSTAGPASFVYPRCVPLKQHVVRIGALKPDNLTPQSCSNWGCDVWVRGATTSVATINASIVCSYLWTLLPRVPNKAFLGSLLGSACTQVSPSVRVLNNAMALVSPKRTRTPSASPVDLQAFAVPGRDLPRNLFQVRRGEGSLFSEEEEARPSKRRKLAGMPGPRGLLGSVLAHSSFETLPAKLSLVLDVVNRLTDLRQAGEPLIVGPKTIKIHPSADAVENFTLPPRLSAAVDYVFSLFAADLDLPGPEEEEVLTAKIVPLALKTFGIDPAEVVLPSKEFVTSLEFRELITHFVVPPRLEVEFTRKPESLPSPPNALSDIRALGRLMLDVFAGRVLNDDEAKRVLEVAREDIVMQTVKTCILSLPDSSEGFQSLPSLATRLDNIMKMVINMHRTDIEKYCAELTREMAFLEASQMSSAAQPVQREAVAALKVPFVPLLLTELPKITTPVSPAPPASTAVGVAVAAAASSAGSEYDEDELLLDTRNFLITGHGGTGKSSLLHRTAAQVATNIVRSGFTPMSLIPIYIPLYGLATSGSSLSEYVTACTKQRYPFLSHLFRKKESNKLLMLFDGLDEVPNHRGVSLTCGERNFVTTRELGGFSHPELAAFAVLRIEPLSLPKQKSFILNQLRVMLQSDVIEGAAVLEEGEGEGESMIAEEEGEGHHGSRFQVLQERLFALINRQTFRPFVRVPCLLRALVATVVKNPGWSPSNSFQLCAKLMKVMLHSLQLRKLEGRKNLGAVKDALLSLDHTSTLPFLERFAFSLHCNKKTQFTQCFCDRRDAERFGRVCQTMNQLMSLSCLPLLVKSGATDKAPLFSFADLNFQAHLVSRYLIKRIKSDIRRASVSSPLKRLMMKHSVYQEVFKRYVAFMIGDVWYTQVLLQLAGGLDKPAFVALIQYLYPKDRCLCNLMVYERPERERKELLRKELRKCNLREEVTIVVDNPPTPSLAHAASVKEALRLANCFNERLRVNIRMTPGNHTVGAVRVTRDNVTFEGTDRDRTVLECDELHIDALNSRFRELRITGGSSSKTRWQLDLRTDSVFDGCVLSDKYLLNVNPGSGRNFRDCVFESQS